VILDIFVFIICLVLHPRSIGSFWRNANLEIYPLRKVNTEVLLKKGLNFDFLSAEEGQFLFETVSTAELTFVANECRKVQKPDGKVTWQIDRNANTTNVCLANCKFCNFFVPPTKDHLASTFDVDHQDGTAYITSIDEYKAKIE